MEYVLLKGAALVHVLYPAAALRPMWDIDLLFRSESDADKARGVLRNADFVEGTLHAAHHHRPALMAPQQSAIFELHTNLTTPPLREQIIGELWERRQRLFLAGEFRGCLLDPASRVIHHALHALNDPVDSPLFRNLFELAWLAHRLDASGRGDVVELSRRWELQATVGRALALAGRWFGSPQLIDPPPRGEIEYWCEKRLEWTQKETLNVRLPAHIARIRFDQFLQGTPPGRICDFAVTLITQGVKAIAHRTAQWSRRCLCPPDKIQF